MRYRIEARKSASVLCPDLKASNVELGVFLGRGMPEEATLFLKKKHGIAEMLEVRCSPRSAGRRGPVLRMPFICEILSQA